MRKKKSWVGAEMGTKNQAEMRDQMDYYRCAYAELKIKLKPEEKTDLEQIEAEYEFCISTSIALLVIGIMYGTSKTPIASYLILVLAAAVILFVGARVQRINSYNPLIVELFTKYKVRYHRDQ